MDFAEKTASITPIKMNSESRFEFKCHSSIECFTLCCRGTNITLTPFDVIRLKNRLGLSSHDFLALYTQPHLLEKTDLPMITLKFLDDDRESCPFVKDGEGCIVYKDRPTACRYYPLGSATLQHKENEAESDFFFFVNEPHCKGFVEKKNWTVAEWREDQGVEKRDIINAEWTDILVRKRSFPASIKLTEKAKQIFFLTSYDIDKFREFVFNTSFTERFDLDDKIVKKISTDEIELLRFGLSWLKDVLFNNTDPNKQASNFGKTLS